MNLFSLTGFSYIYVFTWEVINDDICVDNVISFKMIYGCCINMKPQQDRATVVYRFANKKNQGSVTS